MNQIPEFHPTTEELIEEMGVRATAEMYRLLGFSFKNCYFKIFKRWPTR